MSPPPSKLETAIEPFKKQISRGVSLNVRWGLGSGSEKGLSFTFGISLLKSISKKNLEIWKEIFEQVSKFITTFDRKIRELELRSPTIEDGSH